MKKTFSLILLVLISMTLIGCKNNNPVPIYGDVVFYIIGDLEQYITENEDYNDLGFVAKDNKADISEYVSVNNLVDNSTVGTYTISYTLDYQDKITTLTKTVHVLYLNAACDLIPGTNTLECYKNWSSYLHTVVTVKIYFNQYENINSLEVFDEMENIISLHHKLSDKYNTYDGFVNINTINNNPSSTIVITKELFDLIDFTLEHQKDVSNSFNASLGPVIEIWHDYRENCLTNQICEVPTMADLENASNYTNPKDVILDYENYTITMKENMSLDLGGVSKGYISKKLVEYLNTLPLDGYLINNGESNISIGGTHPTRENGLFLLAITDPTFALPYYATIYLSDGDQLITSGDYQQYYLVDDVLYHHIINNVTLMPERYFRSVSIIYNDPALGDLYSTAIFTMTIKDGQDFVNSIIGLEAIWYGMDGTIYYSDNFEDTYLDTLY